MKSASTASPPVEPVIALAAHPDVAKELIKDYERLREENEQLRERLAATEAQADRFADRLGRDTRRRIFDGRS